MARWLYDAEHEPGTFDEHFYENILQYTVMNKMGFVLTDHV